MFSFDFHNVKIEKAKDSSQLVVKGEVTNCSGKSYSTIAVRIILFVKSTTISNTIFVINGLTNGATKSFEKSIDELDYDAIGKDITHHEIYTESCF